jgi:hypothetical protein
VTFRGLMGRPNAISNYAPSHIIIQRIYNS